MKQYLLLSIAIILALILAACVPQTPTQTVESSPTGIPSDTAIPTKAPDTAAPSDTPLPSETPPPTEPAPATASPTTGAGQPQTIQLSSDLNDRIVSADPGDSDRLAYCAPGEIRISQDAGGTWSSIPIADVLAAAEAVGYLVFPNDEFAQPQCFTVTLDAVHPESAFAVFTTALPEFGAPPVFYMGFFTTDAGETWASVPSPEGAGLDTFGGFWSDGDGTVQALYSPTDPLAEGSMPALVQQTTDGGENWDSASLACPLSGPCLRWGPAAAQIPGMGSPLPQSAYHSADGGETWEILTPTVELRLPGPNELVSLSDSEALLISGSIAYSAEGGSYLQHTEDGGSTWQDVQLPALPDASPGVAYYPGLQILSGGSFLSQSAETAAWMLLEPGSQEWCSLEGINLPAYPVYLQAAGGGLWWFDPETNEAVQTPLTDLVCIEVP